MFKTELAFGATLRRLNNLPIIKVYDLLDYSVADQFQDRYPYVWLQNHRMEIREDFDWSWRPNQNQRDCVHCFPMCNSSTRQPMNWNVLKLVSTDPRMRKQEIQQPLPACYTLENFSMIFFSADTNPERARKKFNAHQLKFGNARLVTNADSLRDAIDQLNPDLLTEHIYVFDINVQIDIAKFEHPDIDIDDALVFCKTNHRSNGITYADGNAVYIHRNYLKRYLQRRTRLDIQVLEEYEFGEFDDAVDPYQAWVSSYTNTIQMELIPDLYDDCVKQRILRSYLDDYNYYLTKQVYLQTGGVATNTNSRLQTYIKDGCQTALSDVETYRNDLNYILKNYRSQVWQRERFQQRQQERQSVKTYPASF